MADPGYTVVQLELENFKSYRGSVVVGPFADFTGVIGPNGSGKSNVMDAVSFVLGVRAAHLRGGNLRDLIYTVEGEQTERRASVTLVLRSREGTELRLRRSVKGDGGGASEYRIDNAVKTWEEYDAALRSLRILTKAKNFLVFQGDVENVAQTSPKDLTALLELVSGSDEYREEYEAKRRRKEEATARMLDASARRRGVGAEKTQYRLQKKEAERFRQLRAEQAALRRDFALFQLFYIEVELTAMKRSLHAAREELRARAALTREGGDEHDRCKREHADLHRKALTLIKAKQEKAARHSQLQRQVDKAALQVKNTEEKLADARAQATKVKETTKQQTKDIQSLQKQLADVRADQAAWEARKAAVAKELAGEALTEAQYQEWRRLKETATTATITLAQDLGAAAHQRTAETLRHQSVAAQAEQLEGRRKQLEETMAQIQERRDQLQGSVRTAEGDAAAAQHDLEGARAAAAQREAKRAELDEAMAAVAAALSDLRFEKQESGRDRRFAEALEQMRGLFAGVKGRVYELCRIPDKRYQTAVTVAMGRTMDAIVVDNAACGMECIQFLKEQRLPPMTFIPLETIKTGRVDEKLRRLGGTCRPVVDCLQFEDAVGPAIRYGVGDTLVCDKLHEARQVAFGERDGERHKVVTVDGSCILKNGCIQGGQATIERKARRWDEHKYEATKMKRDEIARQRDALGDVAAGRSRELELTSRLAALQAARGSLVADIAAADRKLEAGHKELDGIAKQLKELQPRLKEAERRVGAAAARVADLEARRAEVERKIFADFAKRVKISDVEAYEERRDRTAAELAAKDAEFQQLTGRLETQLDFAERRAGLKTVKATEKTIADLEAKLAAERAEQTAAGRDLERVAGELQAVVQEMEVGRKAMALADGRMRELKKAMGGKLDAVGQAKKQLLQRSSAVQRLRSVRAATMLKCRVEEIALPTVPVPARRKAAVEARRKRRRVEEGSVEDLLGEEEEEDAPAADGAALEASEPFTLSEEPSQTAGAAAGAEVLSIDFSGFEERLKAMARNAKEYQKQSALFDDEIQRLGLDLEKLAPNLKAMQRLADAEGKFDDTTKQFEESREEQKRAQADFEAVAERRYTRFMATFDVISDEIDKVYKALTRDEEYPAGGTAFISLDNPLEPYNGGTKYTAMPVTKRFREIEQLSGGEKTVAALALLFTMHRVHPAPFFVLDEVDAALDHGNVVKVCNYVLTHCKGCQFIVISLKPEFFENASTLLGAYKDRASQASRLLSWDLTPCDGHEA